jgi:DNA-binding NarL/FixJ family response regulator
MNVLLIDDDTLTHEIITTFLHHYGQIYNIDVAVKSIHDSVRNSFRSSPAKTEW